MNNYIEKFKELVQVLKLHPSIVLDDEPIYHTLEREDIIDFLKFYDVREIPENLLSFYRQLDGFKLRWHYAPQGVEDIQKRENDNDFATVRGEITIPFMGSMLAYDEFLDDWGLSMLPEEAADLVNFRCIDDNGNNDWIQVGFIIEDKIIKDELYYLQSGDEGFCALECTFDQYIEALIQAKGFVGWQKTFASRTSEFLRNRSDLFFYMHQLFPNEKLESFK